MPSFASIGRIADAENASQGFKRHCALAKLRGDTAMTFPQFLVRHGKNWPAEGTVAEVSEQDARIAALEAELAALKGESKPASKPRGRKPAAKVIAVGVTFRYTRTDGTTTDREVLAVNEDGSLEVRNLEHGVISKRPWRGIERQLAKTGAGSATIL